MNLLGRHLTGLADFSGRENRQPFWLWVAVVMGTAMVAWMAAFIPLFFGMFGRIEQFAREHPDQVTRTVGPGSYSIEVHGYHPELMPDFNGLIGVLLVIVVVIIALLGAAVVRRLHDSGKVAWWGVLPLPFLVGGMALMSRIFAILPRASVSNEPPPEVFTLLGLMMLNNLAYLGTLVVLVIFLSASGTVGPNRFGEDPLGRS